LMQLSSGLYPLKEFPAIIGKEVSGTVIALPTDPVVLENETFKKNKFAVGRKVAAVSLQIWNGTCLKDFLELMRALGLQRQPCNLHIGSVEVCVSNS
jgi:hypothetical protein